MTKIARYICFIAVSLLISGAFVNSGYCQRPYSLVIHSVDKDSLSTADKIGLEKSFASASECDKYLEKLPVILQQKGYMSASVDSIKKAPNQTAIFLFLGEKFDLLNLSIRDRDKDLLKLVGLEYKGDKKRKINFAEYKMATEKLLDYFENTGYPFARVNLDSVSISLNRIDAVLNIEKGFLYRIDSVRTYGPAKISRNFIHHYLDIERGTIYDREKLSKIDQRLLELPYLQQVQPWDVTMLNTGSVVNLYLAAKKSNQVNVLAGFLPSNEQLGGKLLLTVDANLQMQNPLGGGESFGVIWQQIQPKSPRLHLQFTQPYLFNSAFGVDFLFDLYKRDSSFLNINGQIGLLYMLSPGKTAKVILQTQRTNVLQFDTTNVKVTHKLPDVGDVSSVNLGLDYDVENTDYRFNPRRGNQLAISASAGNKAIRKNTAFTQIKDSTFNYSSLYDSVKLKAYQVRLKVNAAQYFKTGKQTVLKTSINAGWYASPSYFRNELFQVGGYRLLRGFDEESIYANSYVVSTLEYRYLVGLNSNLFVFSDFGWSKNNIIKQSNTYLGVGLGLSFETKGGIFNISYATGKRNDLAFDIKQSKIHLGYVSIF